jgi:hypothetical protein
MDTLIILDHFGHSGTERFDVQDHFLDRMILDPLAPWRTSEQTSGGMVTFVDVLNNLESFGHGCR